MTQQSPDTAVFIHNRPRLLGIAYRLMGSLSDAEDVVQETYLQWQNADHAAINSHQAWLTTVCTRRCLDMLRSPSHTRVDYVGTWLPEPLCTPLSEAATLPYDLASSLTTAFLLMLERLTPKERAAYLLREVFEYAYGEIALTLDMEEGACRKLVSRAKIHVQRDKVRQRVPSEQQNKLLKSFQNAVTEGDLSEITELLSNDVKLSSDGGGKVPAILEVLEGREKVSDFLTRKLSRYWLGRSWSVSGVNGNQGVLIRENGTLTAIVSFSYTEYGLVDHICIIRNPDKIKMFCDKRMIE